MLTAGRRPWAKMQVQASWEHPEASHWPCLLKGWPQGEVASVWEATYAAGSHSMELSVAWCSGVCIISFNPHWLGFRLRAETMRLNEPTDSSTSIPGHVSVEAQFQDQLTKISTCSYFSMATRMGTDPVKSKAGANGLKWRLGGKITIASKTALLPPTFPSLPLLFSLSSSLPCPSLSLSPLSPSHSLFIYCSYFFHFYICTYKYIFLHICIFTYILYQCISLYECA